ncbi:MAG: glycerophosphodiester phosphodiesterase, partial [Actinomycetota bacterium]|nr:glycerophosphodiester phosphodiesterase [Actinomycetota bacterium]
ARKWQASRELVNIGHRGASLHAPENTLASFDLALSMGAHYLELDVHITKDGHLVVFHDEDLDRVVRAPAQAMGGLVSALTWSDLSDLDVGSWFSEIYAGTKMVTLEEVLARYRHCARLCIELKGRSSEDEPIGKLLSLLHRFELVSQQVGPGRVIVLSFEEPTLQALAAACPQLDLMLLFDSNAAPDEITWGIRRADAFAFSIGLDLTVVGEAIVNEAHAHGLFVYPYTVNDSDDMVRLLAAGVDGMITDAPDRLDLVLRQMLRVAHLAS